MNLADAMHYLRLGGTTLAFILGASLLALGVAIERLVALWNVSDDARRLAEVVTRHLLQGDVPAARGAVERSSSVAATFLRVGFERLERSRPAGASLEAAVERERTQVGLHLKKNLWILGTIGAVTPFVGLFGTVSGIMRSFKDLGIDVEAGGSGGSAAVMTGISEALIATAAGILVAVEAVVLYNYFQARLARISVELRLVADEVVELLWEAVPRAVASTPEASSPAASAVDGAP
jgi:biopolymer transport protein ExbB/TolQ